jgi:hypothetical protein
MNAIARLRDFARRPADRCGLCGSNVADRHAHLVEAATGGLLCACPGCATVFDHASGRFRRVPDRVLRVDVSDRGWEALGIPISLAFLRRSSSPGTVRASYPSALGAVESSVDDEAWASLVRECPVLESMAPDVEALLVRRGRDLRESYIVPIDRGHALIGLLRREWRGMTGGDAVGPAIDRFFETLRADAGGPA